VYALCIALDSVMVRTLQRLQHGCLQTSRDYR